MMITLIASMQRQPCMMITLIAICTVMLPYQLCQCQLFLIISFESGTGEHVCFPDETVHAYIASYMVHTYIAIQRHANKQYITYVASYTQTHETCICIYTLQTQT